MAVAMESHSHGEDHRAKQPSRTGPKSWGSGMEDKNEESPLNIKYLNAISVNIDNDIDRFTSKLSNIHFFIEL